MAIDNDLEVIAQQEARLQFAAFDKSTAWALGAHLKSVAEVRGVGVTIEIRIARETVFFYSMPGAHPTNADWARRKRNVCELMERSSYGVGLSLAKEGATLEGKMGLPTRDYAAHGGSFPIRVAGVGPVGTVTVSGLPQRDDHVMVVDALATLTGVALDGMTLE